MNAFSAVMHLVHDATLKFVKLCLVLLVALVSATSTLAQAREIDLTEWQSMDPNTYFSIAHGIQSGDTVVFKIDGNVNSFEIEKKLSTSSDVLVGPRSASVVFLLKNGKILKLPDQQQMGHLQTLFVEAQKEYAKAGVDVVPIAPESHPPDFVIVDYVPFRVTIREMIPLILENNSGQIAWKMRRLLKPNEKEEMREAGIKFIQSLASLTQGVFDDFGTQQMVYDTQSKSIKIIDFGGPPGHFDPDSHRAQSTLVEYWHDDKHAKDWGPDTTHEVYISTAELKALNNIIEEERTRIRQAVACEVKLDLPLSKVRAGKHPQGPTGT